MLLIIELVGAIGLLLFGLRQVRNGMMRAFGTSLKRLARRTEGRVLPTFLWGYWLRCCFKAAQQQP